MPDFLKYFDGTSRQPRAIQKEALEWFAYNWSSTNVLAGNFPTATGKSALAQAISLVTGAHIITPSNLLIDQYITSYPKKNYLKGKSHYNCTTGYTCDDWTNQLQQDYCTDCPYQKCKEKALDQATFFNPMSLYYLSQSIDWQQPGVIVVDEAHTLPGMLLMLCGTRLRHSMFKFPENVVNEVYLGKWLSDQILKLAKLVIYYKTNPTRFAEITQELEKLKLVKRGLDESAENYAIWIEPGSYRGKPDRFLNIKPIKPPRFVVDKLLSAKKLILMSATLVESDIKDLVGDQPYRFLDLPSPIPIENRPVYVRPTPFKMNWETPPKLIVGAIEKILDENPGQNTIIHVPYSMSKKLVPHFTRPIIVNDQTNKDEKLEFFKQHGGIFLAAGCAEGIDLKGDLCRINIIPKIPFPNLGDPVVKKRRALEDGDTWYALEALKSLIQMAGRSTRDIEDYSKIFVLDPGFSRLVQENRAKLPASFISSIRFAKE